MSSHPLRSLIFLPALLFSFSTAACGDDTTTGGGGSGGSDGGGGGAGGGEAGIQIEGLTDGVTATYDQNGLLHLTCATDDDCFAALGYFHASNRFFFMDFIRNLVRGRLGALVEAGNAVLTQDFANRRWFSTSQGDPLETKLYEDASDEVRGHLDAYARGVNAWIEDMRAGENGATLTVEYDFDLIVKEAIRDWEPEDSAAVGLYVLDDLSNNSGSEIEVGAALPTFDPILAADLFSARPVFDAFTVPAANQSSFAPPKPADLGLASRLSRSRWLLEDAADRLRLVGGGHLRRQAGEIGSNNWVVGPDRTSSGNALLANDPHLPLSNPSIWFAVELDAKSEGDGTYHVAGSTFPGLPSVMVGHNESIGWGVTTAYYDLADVYVEEVSADGTSVLFDGEDVPIIEKDFSFDDASTGEPVMQTFRWVPHHGPIMSEDTEAGTAITIRWRGHEGGMDLDAFFEIARASSVAEARDAVELASSASQNFVFIDTAGDIGWYPYAKVPQRPWASDTLAPWLPLPGDGSAEWGPPVPFEDLPQLTNPPAGAIATANGDMTGASADGDILNDGQDALQAVDKAEGTREQRILDLIEGGGNEHSVDSMHVIQGDDFSLYGEALTPVILAAAELQTPTAEQQDVIDALTDWSYTCPTGLDGSDPETADDSSDPIATVDSIGCTVFHAVLFAIVDEALGDEVDASGASLGTSRWDLHLVVRAILDPSSIASGDALWDDVTTQLVIETRDQILYQGLARAAAVLAGVGAQDSWRWGRVHTITLRSIFDNFGLKTYNEGPYAAPGALYTVNVANPRRTLPEVGDPWLFEFTAGASVRFVVEAREEGPRMTYELPGGNDLHRESEFYNNLLPGWLANEPIEFPFGPGAVSDPASVLTVSPASP